MPAYYTDQILDRFPKEPTLAVQAFCKHFLTVLTSPQPPNSTEFYLESFALGEALARVAGIQMIVPNFPGDSVGKVKVIRAWIMALAEKADHRTGDRTLEQSRERFAARFGGGFTYEFSEGDLTKIQSLVDKLRKQVQAEKGLTEDHRRRLLARLEKLQAELHKRVSDLDRFWGLVGEAGVIVGQVGERAKPILECIKQIADIIWITQARAESLPSSAPNVMQLRSPGEEGTKTG